MQKYELLDTCSVYTFAEQMANDPCLRLPWNEISSMKEGFIHKFHGLFTEIRPARCSEVYQSPMLLRVSAVRIAIRESMSNLRNNPHNSG